MEQKIKLDLSDLRIDSFGAEDGQLPDGTVQAYITGHSTTDCGCDTSVEQCTAFDNCVGQSGATCDYTCVNPPCETSPAPCSQNPPDGASCDATCAQLSTCVYTGPQPGCC